MRTAAPTITTDLKDDRERHGQSALLVVVAAGILAYGIRAFQTAARLPGLAAAAFDVSERFSLSSRYGALLRGIFNFRPDPTVLQLMAGCGYVAVVLPLFLRPVRTE